MKTHRLILNIVLTISLLLISMGTYTETPPTVTQYFDIQDNLQRLFYRVAIANPNTNKPDMVYYWKGAAYVNVPGDIYAPPYPGAPGQYYPHGGGNGGTPLLGFEGYNIRNVVPYIDPTTGEPSETDFVMLTREVLFYTDPNTGETLTQWTNPLTGKTTPVMPVLNEYLFSRYRVVDGVLKAVQEIHYRSGGNCQKMEVDSPISGPDDLLGENFVWAIDVYPRYKLNDCGRYNITDPMGLKNNKYTSNETFDFYVPERFENKVKNNGKGQFKWVPATSLTWVRIGPPLPWMCMSQTNYQLELVYHGVGELLYSWDEIPEDFKTRMQEYGFPLGGLDYEGWQEAPSEYIPDKPGDTSWSVFYQKVLQPAGQTYDQWCNSYP
jgi:hypothetical protein